MDFSSNCEGTEQLRYFKCGNSDVVSRHINIEFIFGDYFELHEEDALFQSIFIRCNLQTISEESEKKSFYTKNYN